MDEGWLDGMRIIRCESMKERTYFALADMLCVGTRLVWNAADTSIVVARSQVLK